MSKNFLYDGFGGSPHSLVFAISYATILELLE
jgi:hypothetical protein